MNIKNILTSSTLALGLVVATVSFQPVMAQPAPAAAPADATLSLSGGAVAAGVGFVWGSGTLDIGGVAHKVKVSGLSIVDLGAANISAAGSVYHLNKLSDFNGVYTTFSAGATIAGGGGVAYLRNQNGVVIRLDSTTQGLRFNLAASGVTLKIRS
jgi:hypothetical protein